MNQAQQNGVHSLFTPKRFKDFEVSWAGPHPFQPGFCFGSEDGRLLFTDDSFAPVLGPGKGSISGESINGVAYWGDWIAVSTRADVTVGRLHEAHRLGLSYGAHGVVAAPSGCFAAPMGRTGIMMIKAGCRQGDAVGVLTSDKEGMHFYRVTALRGRNEKDLLVCAAGKGGIGITEPRWGEPTYNMRVAAFDGIDVVDTCRVASDPSSPAVAAVGRDGTVIMVRDASSQSKLTHPISIKFTTIQGTAYRLLSMGDDIFLLTSRALYVLRGLAVNLAKAVSAATFITHILIIPMEAVDANIINDRWLLIVTPDEVLIGDLDVIQQLKSDAGLANGQVEETPQLLDPIWHVNDLESRTRELAVA